MRPIYSAPTIKETCPFAGCGITVESAPPVFPGWRSLPRPKNYVSPGMRQHQRACRARNPEERQAVIRCKARGVQHPRPIDIQREVVRAR